MGETIIYGLGGIVLIAILALILSLPTMWLWNWLMPHIFGLVKITWLEALGLDFLSGIFFSHTVKINNN